MLQQLDHQIGNNYQAVKTKRVNVEITANSTNNNPRFYFPDIPELNNVQIVGIEAHMARPLGLLFGDLHYNLVGNNFWTVPLIQFSYINLVNIDNELVIQNFPCLQLFNPTAINPNQAITSVQKSGKIIPIYSRLLLRQCYIYIATAIPTNTTATATFTFYHLGKK